MPRKRRPQDGRLTKTGALVHTTNRPLFIVLRHERFAASLPDLWHGRHDTANTDLGTMPDFDDTEGITNAHH